MKINKKPTLDDYDEYIDNMPEYTGDNAAEYSEIIENLIENRPDARNKKRYDKWKSKTNKMIDGFNTKYGKLYSRIK